MKNNSMQRLVVNTLFQEMTDHHNRKDGFRETRKLDLYWKLRPVACVVKTDSRLEFGLWTETILTRELVVNTLFHEMMNYHNQKDGFSEIQELDPYWKLRPVACTGNMELKSESGLWEKIILNPGSEFLMDHNNFVFDSNNNNTEVPDDLLEEQVVAIEGKGFCSQIKGESKTTKKRTCWCTKHHSDEWKKVDWYWTRKFLSLCVRDFEESNPSSPTDTLKQYNEKKTEQFNSGELRVNFHKLLIGLTIVGKHAWQQEEERKGDISTALMFQEQLFTSELFKDTSGRNLINPSLQDNVVIQSGFFQHIYHIGCAV